MTVSDSPETGPKRRMKIPLEAHPRIAACVGFVAGHFAFMEDQMCQLYAYLMGLDSKRAQLTFYEFTPRRRREVLKALLSEIDKNPARVLISAIDKRIKKVTDRRNALMHHIWLGGGDSGLFRADPAKPISVKPLIRETEASAEDLLLTISVLNNDLQEMVFDLKFGTTWR